MPRKNPNVFCVEGQTHRFRSGRLWRDVEKALRESFSAYGSPRGRLTRIHREDGGPNHAAPGAYRVTFTHPTMGNYNRKIVVGSACGDGTSGQDRESYTDTQDRESYYVDPSLSGCGCARR